MKPFDGTHDAPPPVSGPARRPPQFVPTKVTRRPTAPKKKPAARRPPTGSQTTDKVSLKVKIDESGVTINDRPSGDFTAGVEVTETIDPRNAQRIADDPPLRTNAVIADAVEKAIQGISLARRLTIKRIEVKPEYGVDGDLLTADVRVGFGMIFARREE